MGLRISDAIFRASRSETVAAATLVRSCLRCSLPSENWSCLALIHHQLPSRKGLGFETSVLPFAESLPLSAQGSETPQPEAYRGPQQALRPNWSRGTALTINFQATLLCFLGVPRVPGVLTA